MEINVYDVVQIKPEHRWGGCFITVTKIKPWGIQGYTIIPLRGCAYIWLKHHDYVKIGRAGFIKS